MNLQEFAFYLDESGSPKPNPKDQAKYFAVGGVLIKREDEVAIEQKIVEFKERWNIPLKTPLHGNEIRSKKKSFAWLGRLSSPERDQFFEDLTDTIIQCPIIVNACVVSRQGYLERYLEKYGLNTWEMMKSAFSILLERISKYAALQNGKVMIYFEKAGRREDHLLKSYFDELKNNATPFSATNSAPYQPLTAEQFQQTLTGIQGKSKCDPVMQISDLCLYPLAKAKENPHNRALEALTQHQKLVDNVLTPDQLQQMSIKYYCFDRATSL